MNTDSVKKSILLVKWAVAGLGIPVVASVAIYFHNARIDSLQTQVETLKQTQYESAYKQIDAQKKLHSNEVEISNQAINQEINKDNIFGPELKKSLVNLSSGEEKFEKAIGYYRMGTGILAHVAEQERVRNKIFSVHCWNGSPSECHSELDDFLQVVIDACKNVESEECAWIKRVLNNGDGECMPYAGPQECMEGYFHVNGKFDFKRKNSLNKDIRVNTLVRDAGQSSLTRQSTRTLRDEAAQRR